MAQTWLLRKLVDLERDGILHPIQMASKNWNENVQTTVIQMASKMRQKYPKTGPVFSFHSETGWLSAI